MSQQRYRACLIVRAGWGASVLLFPHCQSRHVAQLLKPGGHFAVVAPAVPWLCGTMDAADQHRRRYRLADMVLLFESGGLEFVSRK